jgi:hypothetical protein
MIVYVAADHFTIYNRCDDDEISNVRVLLSLSMNGRGNVSGGAVDCSLGTISHTQLLLHIRDVLVRRNLRSLFHDHLRVLQYIFYNIARNYVSKGFPPKWSDDGSHLRHDIYDRFGYLYRIYLPVVNYQYYNVHTGINREARTPNSRLQLSKFTATKSSILEVPK